MARTAGSATKVVTAGNARYRIWRSMRILRRFTMAELCATAEAGRWNVQQYVLGLVRAGYVMCQPWRQMSDQRVYALTRNSGPNPPRLRKDGSIHDPNLKVRNGGTGNEG